MIGASIPGAVIFGAISLFGVVGDTPGGGGGGGGGGGVTAPPSAIFGQAIPGFAFPGQTGSVGVVTPPADTTPPTVPQNVVAIATPDGAIVTWDASIDPGGDTTPPSQPANLRTTTVTTTTVGLAWNASTDNVGVTAYKVYRDGAAIQTLGNVLAFTDTGRTAGVAYAYQVSALDSDGNESALSAVLNVTTLASGAVVVTPSAYGPTIPTNPGSTVAGGTFVVKADGLIYDSGGTTLQDLTSKEFSTLVTIKSDVAGTRRNIDIAARLAGSRFLAGLITDELYSTSIAALNFGIRDPSTAFGWRHRGCGGLWRHHRITGFTQAGLSLEKSPAGLYPGSNQATYDTSVPDLIIENFTTHAAVGATGAGIVVSAGRNVRLGGWDPGGQSTPTGIPGVSPGVPAIIFDGATLDDVVDVVVTVATDGTPSLPQSAAGTYTGHILKSRRCGFNANPPGQFRGGEGGVLFPNTLGSRPEKPVWLGGAGTPGTETSVNTTAVGVACDQPIMWDCLAQQLVNYTFREGTTKQQAFEVDRTVWDPAVPLSMWSEVYDQPTAVRFIDGRGPLGPRPVGASPALVNKTVIDRSFTLPGGSGGSVSIASDGWVEVRGVKFDPGVDPAHQIWIDGGTSASKVFQVDTDDGAQLVVASGASQTGGSMPSIPPWDGVGGGGVRLKVTAPGGGSPDFSKWDLGPPGANPGEQGIYTNFPDPNGVMVDTAAGLPYFRQLVYRTIDLATNEFVGVYFVKSPTGGAINAPPGEVLKVTAGTPGSIQTWNPHGQANDEQVSVAGVPGVTDGTYRLVYIANNKFSLKTLAGATVTILLSSTNTGTYTPLGPGGGGYTYGLSGCRNTAFQLTAGTTLDSPLNLNLGQPTCNAILQIGEDTRGIRFVGCDTQDVELSAVSSNVRSWLAECDLKVSALPDHGRDYTTVNEGVKGCYDPSNQHMLPRTLGSLNVVSAAEAWWVADGIRVTDVHGDVWPGRVDSRSILRNSKVYHSRDANNTTLLGSQSRPQGVATPWGTNLPKVQQGPHGDQFQVYDRQSMPCVNNDHHSNGNNSICFSRMARDYFVFDHGYNNTGGGGSAISTALTMVNSGGKIKVVFGQQPDTPSKTKQWHNFNPGAFAKFTGTGNPALDGHEFLVTDTTKSDITLDANFISAFSGFNVIHVIHLNWDFRRCSLRISRHFDRSDITDSTALWSKGNKTVWQGDPAIANDQTLIGTFWDNRWETSDGVAWQLPVIKAGCIYDLGTGFTIVGSPANRNYYRNNGAGSTDLGGAAIAVPGAVATPKLNDKAS